MRLLSKCLVLFLAVTLHVQAQAPSGELIHPAAVAVDAVLHRAFAVDPAHNRVLVYDEATARQTEISVGHSPIALAIDPQAHRVYVVNAGGGNVSVVDELSATVIATLATDSRPYAIAIDPAMHRTLVSNTFSNKLTVLDGTRLTSEQKPLGSKDAIAVDPLHGEAFLVSYEDPAVTVITSGGEAPRKLPARIHLWSIADDALHRTLYATAIGDHALEVLRTDTGERAEIPVGNFPCALALTHDGSRAYVVNREDDTVTLVDTAARRALATIPVGKQPQAIALDELHHHLFVANTAAGTITVLDSRTNQPLRTLPAGPAPYALAVDEARGELFIANLGGEPFHHLAVP